MSARLGAVGILLILAASIAYGKGAKKAKTGLAKGTGVVVSLEGDREVKGVYLGRRDGAVWIGLDGGEIGLDTATVLKITPTATPESEFLERKAALDPQDADGWWELSKWAQERGLTSSAQSAAETVVALRPEHAEARTYLGHEKVNGVWIDFAEGQRLRGMVEFKGEWMPRMQAESIMMKREVETGAKVAQDLRRSRERKRPEPPPEDSRIHGYTEPLAVSPGADPMSPSRAIKRNDVKPLDQSQLRP